MRGARAQQQALADIPYIALGKGRARELKGVGVRR